MGSQHAGEVGKSADILDVNTDIHLCKCIAVQMIQSICGLNSIGQKINPLHLEALSSKSCLPRFPSLTDKKGGPMV